MLAPAGTKTTIDVALQLLIDVAAVPLNVTVLVPCVAPKLEPLIVTEAPAGPEPGETLLITGGAKYHYPTKMIADTALTVRPT